MEMKEKLLGSLLIVISTIAAALYLYLLFLAPEPIPTLTLKLTALAIVFVLLAVLGWIGYVLLTTGSPEDVEKLVRELEEKGELSEEGG